MTNAQDLITTDPFGLLPERAAGSRLAEPVVPVALDKDQAALLDKDPPAGAVQTAKKGTGANAPSFEYVPWPHAADALDKLCGVGGWRMVCTSIREVPKGNHTEIVWMGVLIGVGLDPPVQTTGYGLFFNSGGMGWSDAFQSAESRALTKAAGRLGVYRHQWLKEDAVMKERELKGPTARPPARQGPRPPATVKPPTNTGARQAEMTVPKDAAVAVAAQTSDVEQARRTFGGLVRDQLGLGNLQDVLPLLGLKGNGGDIRKVINAQWWDKAAALGLDLQAVARCTVMVMAGNIRTASEDDVATKDVAADSWDRMVALVRETKERDA